MGNEQSVNTLFLRLEGVLQSWGERGRWTVRDTSTIPTKSGVVGLLGAALGIHDDRLVALSNQLKMGVRVDKPGTVVLDYHTVTSGVMMAQGGIKGGEGEEQTVVSHRFYLSGASFLVALRGEQATIEQLADAVQNPVWFLYLGRHCCIPSAPIYAGIGYYDDLLAALRVDNEQHQYEIEGGSTLRMDSITSVPYRSFQARCVTRLTG